MASITISWPKGIPVPEGKVAGDKFVSMVDFELMENGKVKVIAIDDEPLAEAKEDEEIEEQPGDEEVPEEDIGTDYNSVMGSIFGRT